MRKWNFKSLDEVENFIMHEILGTVAPRVEDFITHERPDPSKIEKPQFYLEIRLSEAYEAGKDYADDCVLGVNIILRTFHASNSVFQQKESAETIDVKLKEVYDFFDFLGELFEHFDYNVTSWVISDSNEKPESCDLYIFTATPPDEVKAQ